jgi:hypothetical protein
VDGWLSRVGGGPRGLSVSFAKAGVGDEASSYSKVVMSRKKRMVQIEANRGFLTASWECQQTCRSQCCEVLESP